MKSGKFASSKEKTTTYNLINPPEDDRSRQEPLLAKQDSKNHYLEVAYKFGSGGTENLWKLEKGGDSELNNPQKAMFNL